MADRLLFFPYHHPSDLEIITDLLQHCRDSETITDPPGVNDLKEMLQKPIIQKRTRLWTTHEGLPIGYMLVDDYNNLVFDFLKGFLTVSLEDQIIKQAVDYLQVNLHILEETTLDASVREDDEKRIAMLMRGGFHRQPVETLTFRRNLSQLSNETPLPEGYTIRQFKGESELPDLVILHQTAFETKNMTVEHRADIMNTPDYDPVLDLVVVAPDNRLAGYAIGTIDRVSNQLSGKKSGNLDTIAVHPQHQRKGLATCLVERILKLISLYGMEQATLSTSSECIAMQTTAKKTGFHLAGKRLWYSKRIFKQ
jgi:ribosomal protein S18 acetylase RimI-like enzyme